MTLALSNCLPKLPLQELETQRLAAKLLSNKANNGSADQTDDDLLKLQVENTKLKHRLAILRQVCYICQLCGVQIVYLMLLFNSKSIAEESKAGGSIQVEENSSITEHLHFVFAQAIALAFPEYKDTPVSIAPVNSASAKFGDYQCNNAMKLAKQLKEKGINKSPRDIATEIQRNCPASPLIEKLEVAGAGFVNVFLSK